MKLNFTDQNRDISLRNQLQRVQNVTIQPGPMLGGMCSINNLHQFYSDAQCCNPTTFNFK